VRDEGFTAEADAIFDEDLKNCLPLDPRRWRRRSAMRRAREIASRIVRHEV